MFDNHLKDDGPKNTLDLSPTPRVPNISKEDFIKQHKIKQKPVIIEQVTNAWPARQTWNLEYLKNTAGDNLVPLYDSRPSTGHKHQHAAEIRMPLRDYIELLENGEKNLRLFCYNILFGLPELGNDFSYPDIGLKFFKKLPVLFLAGKGARVQMHFDVDMADLLLCHFGGQKRILLFPPSQTRNMYRVPYSFSSLYDIDFENPDYDKYPALRHLQGEVATLQNNDALYIPPGYWHYVIYDEISFSMTLRAFPRKPANLLAMIRNLVITRTVDGLMRKIAGQYWNDRNRRKVLNR